ncbi:hypothetical protein [Rhodococcus sp. BH5]|uniref:hypothetical protein n=1 Tax=Rhodococcus sp. BH5 TaxID=2871702 RepID=UPI0022CD2645|nr:hypothetical protein [Rhodococcus sp. BH5]MCZ9635362.1 hypothetical protein [Rhodococcus sp. BH5]
MSHTVGVSEMVTVKRCVKYPLTPSLPQTQILIAQANAARVMWNLIHAHHTFHEASHRWPTWTDSDAAIRQARKDIDWLAVLPAQAAQQVLKAYVQAWKSYWAGTHGRPKFKSRRARRAVDVPQARDLNITRLNRKCGTVQIPKVGVCKVRLHRALPEKVTGARVVLEATGGCWSSAARTKSSNPAHVVQSAARSESIAVSRTQSPCRTGRSSTNQTP